MALAGEPPPRSRLIGFVLAAGVPLACYLATASAYGYWFDSGEFVAASAQLGISHPPGQPLSALAGSLAMLLPLGPLPLRVALVSAMAAALAAGFLFLAVETTVRSLGVKSRAVSYPLSLGATWIVAGSYGFWFQGVRPEVYALQAALLLFALERIIALETAWPTRNVRPLYAASLAIGLALANHHFLAILVLPALAPTLARVWRQTGTRSLLRAGGFGALGLSTYLYLPIRASVNPPLNLGHPDTLDRLYWVVSAQTFQKNTGEGVPQPLWERFADIGVLLVEDLHWLPVLLALAGAYVLLRAPGARRIGFVWIVTLAVFIAARAWLGFVRGNPDALGYLMPAVGALGALAAAFVAAVLALLGGADQERPRRTSVAVAAVLVVLGLAQIHRSVDRASLARFTATDTLEEVGRRRLPPHAIVIAHAPQTIFRQWGGEAADLVRPDVTIVPIPLLSYPELVDDLVERDPELAGVLRGYLLDGRLPEGELQSLAAERPVLVEMDVRVPTSLYATMVPDGLFHLVLPDDAYDDDRRAGQLRQDKIWQTLYRLLGPRGDRETENQLLWHHYVSALYYAGVGERGAAIAAADRGLAINPEAAELRALRAALLPLEDDTPLDVMPFMP